MRLDLMRVRQRLRLRQRARGAVWHRVRPPRPPLESPEHVTALSETSEDEDFITGNGFAARCRYVLNFDVLRINEDVENEWWFCKSDFLEYFFAKLAPKTPYVLFSHNSDRTIDGRLARRLDSDTLRAWFSPNVALAHPKLHALPLGIANPKWRHGNADDLEGVQKLGLPKTRLFDASFSLRTNALERTYCLEQTGVQHDPPLAFDEYLKRLSSSYFCLSPRGAGIDCHRTWESLYVGTIPVVTRSVLTDQHADFPLVVLDDWSEFRSIDFSPALYESLWKAWDPTALRLDSYVRRVESRLEASG